MKTNALWNALLALSAGCAAHPLAGSTCPPAVLASKVETAAPPSGADPVVARIGDETITFSEVDRAIGRELYELRDQTLDKLIGERVVAAAAKKAGVPVEAYLAKQAEAKVPEVSEATAREFYDKNQDRLKEQLGDKKFADVKAMIIRGLTEQARHDATGQVVEELKRAAGVKVTLEAPRMQVAAVGPAKGPADAKVTIVEFSDFQCPFCLRGKQVIDEVVKAYGTQVRVVFRDFPLSFHEDAERAAEAGHCADEQGKFWPMHDWMFDNQKTLGAGELKSAAGKLGLDGKKFAQCLDSGRFAGAVSANQKAGEEAGVRGTPAFFINGASLSGAQPFEKFKSEIDRALAR